MKPEKILQSDVLDIIFDGRNKDYGAYTLRKNYNQRLLQSLGVIVVLTGVFFILQSMTVKSATDQAPIIPETFISDVIELPKDDVEKPKPQVDKPLPKATPQPTIDNTVPIIKKEFTETEVPPITALEGRVISNITNDLPSTPGGEVVGDPTPTTDGTSLTPTVDPEPADAGPLDFAEIMPSFNGDLVKFMLRHLRQPDDLEDGERIVIRVKFVVDADGNISDAAIVQSGRADLDAEVLRVVKKMPRWNPGKQAGRSVPVFFNMPVTFVSNP